MFEYFCELAGKTTDYTLTEARKKMATARWKDALRIKKRNVAAAKVLFKKAIDAMMESEWHRKKGQLKWELLFRSEDKFTEWIDRFENPAEEIGVA